MQKRIINKCTYPIWKSLVPVAQSLIEVQTLNTPWVLLWWFQCVYLIPLIKDWRWRVPFLLPSDFYGDSINGNGKLSYILQTRLDDRYWKNHLLTSSNTVCVILNLSPYFLWNCISAVACKRILWLKNLH